MLPCRGYFFVFSLLVVIAALCLFGMLCKQFLHYCRDGLAVSLASHFL